MPAASVEVLASPAALHFDANGDGRISIADAMGVLEQLFFLPGDWSIWALAKFAPPVARFFDLDSNDYRGLVSGCIATAVWVLATIVANIAYAAVVEADRRATRRLAGGYAETRRRVGIAARLFYARGWRRAKSEPERRDFEFSADAGLDAHEVRLLDALAELGPGYAAPVSELAAKQAERRRDTEDRLDALARRKLVIRTVGGADGGNAYALSAAGRAALLQHRLRPRGPQTGG